MRRPDAFVLMVPGIDGSDEAHWQSRWQDDLGDGAGRIAPSSWTAPELDDWLAAIDRALPDRPTLLIAHSLGCLAVGRWLTTRTPGPVRGAVLVAPPDSSGPRFPAAAGSFVGRRVRPLPVPGLVIAGDDDPYAAPEATRRLAAAWDVPVVTVARGGHLNSASGLGDWPAGRNLVTAFRAGRRL